MKRPPLVIIIFRYILVIGLLYAIWQGKMWAIQLTCALCILHSELIYVTNRIQEAQIAKLMNKKSKEIVDNGPKENAK